MEELEQSRLESFRHFREKMNDRILEIGNLDTKRFFGLDSKVYEDGELPAATKELLGLVSSMVLRCDDCISYHLIRCREQGISKTALMETFNIALLVGGSIVIPHLRRAVELLDELDENR